MNIYSDTFLRTCKQPYKLKIEPYIYINVNIIDLKLGLFVYYFNYYLLLAIKYLLNIYLAKFRP